MLDVEDWAEIRRLHRSEGVPIKAIARVMGCSNTATVATTTRHREALQVIQAPLRDDGLEQSQRSAAAVGCGGALRGRA